MKNWIKYVVVFFGVIILSVVSVLFFKFGFDIIGKHLGKTAEIIAAIVAMSLSCGFLAYSFVKPTKKENSLDGGMKKMEEGAKQAFPGWKHTVEIVNSEDNITVKKVIYTVEHPEHGES